MYLSQPGRRKATIAYFNVVPPAKLDRKFIFTGAV